MFLKKSRHFIFVVLSFLTYVSIQAQTLYWVGGSGNFNDPKHWSLSSGGPSSNLLPSLSTDVVFDDRSAQGYFIVNITNDIQANSFSARLMEKAMVFNGNYKKNIQIAGSFLLSNRVRFNAPAEFIFNSHNSKSNTIDIAGTLLNSNVAFKSGTYDFIAFQVTDTKTISFGSGNYNFRSTILSAGSIVNTEPGAHFNINDSYFKAAQKFKILDAAKIQAEGVYIMADINSVQNFAVPSALSNSKGYSSLNTVNVVCPVTISISPACSGSCTGVLTVSLAPSCTTAPYSVSVTNTGSGCGGFASALTNTNIPSVYTVTNACICPTGNYLIVVRDGANSLQTFLNGANFTPNPAIIFDGNVQPQCSYSCDGTLLGSIIGNPPFSVTVTAPGTVTIPSFTTPLGDYTITSMCAGVYTFNITDAGGCVSTVTNALNAPLPLLANAVTSTITCNGANNGALSVTPSGGTANYTVNFSNLTSSVTSGGSAVASGLGVGLITATITDAQGCIANASGNITQPGSTVSVVMTQTNLTCNAVCIGAVSATASGGTAPYTYSWSASASTLSSRTNLCASAGTETLIVFDANNCSTAIQTFSITQPTAIVAVPSQTNVVCNGAATGIASLSVSGGTGAYTFSWTAPGPATLAANASSQTGLLSYPAPYTVTVNDANNCTITPIFFTITQPTVISFGVLTKTVECFGTSTGGASVSPLPSGGNGPTFTYTWTNISTSSVVANLPVTPGIPTGTYALSVADASGCVSSTSVVIVGPASGLSPVVSFTSQSCNIANASCNGTITSNPTGGSSPYTYTLLSSGAPVLSSGANASFTGLCAGTYSLIVGSSTSLCPIQSVLTLTTPAALNPNISINTPLPCFGSSVGGLTGNAGTGGTPTYSLTWVAPTGTLPGNPTSISSLTAGVYTMIVTDSKSCTTSTSIALTQPSSITIAVAASSISCFSGLNGVITSTTTGGSPGYAFVWTNSLGITVGNTATASALSPGPYTLTATDVSLCVAQQTATVLSPPPITLTAITSAVKCFGGSTGGVTLTPSGGTTPYNSTYTLNAGGFPIFSTNTNTNLAAGNYTATMTDANSCVQTVTFAITQPTALAAAISGTGSCNVCTGSATVTPSFGTPPYSYIWSPGAFSSTTTISGLCPANYSVTVLDAQGCTTATNIAINQIVNVSINASPSSILCFGATTGSASTNPSGGTPAYTYSWSTSPAQTTSVLTNVGIGTYTVFVTDSSVPVACSHSAVVTLTSPPAMTVTSTQTNVTCFGFTNGAITTTLSGGVGPYTQTWTPTGLLTTSLSNIGANVYTLNVRDANLCPAAVTISITESPSISIAVSKTDPSGCTTALANGSICATGTGGSGSGYSYTLTSVSGPTTNLSGCFTGLGAGNYSIQVMDGAGCINNTLTSLSTPSAPIVSAVSSSVTCFGFSTAVASATISNGVAPYTISWSPVVSVTTSPTGTLTSASGLPQGTYFITATDLVGCSITQSVGITQAASVTINGNTSNLTCNTNQSGSITVAPTGGTPGTPSYTYAWIPAASITSGATTATVTGLTAGIFTLNLLDANNCTTAHTFTLTQPPAITLSAITSSVLCNSNCTGSIVANTGGGTGVLNYSWTPIGGNTATVTNLCANTGTNPPSYTLTITDANNCVKTDTYVIIQPSALTSTVGFVSASCSNSCNAVATNSVSGGTTGYSYTWNTSTVTTSSLGALCSGTYIATVTDGNGCVLPTTFTITPPAPLSVTLSPVNPLCNAACNGSITTVLSGAQGAVTFSWLPAGSGQSPTGLCAVPNPNYTLVARDQNSCEVTAVATLTNPPALLASVTHTNPLCHNDVNGIASVSFTNAVGATSYNWIPTGPPTQTAQTATGLASGSYTVVVLDNNLCQASVSFSITNPSTISPNPSIGASSCSLSIGQIVLNPTGGTPGNPTAYTYSWSAPLSSSASSVTGLAANLYSVQITDGNGCTTFTTLAVSDSNGPNNIPILSTSVICNAQCTGGATVDIVNVSGGTAPYTAIWTNPSSTNSAVSNLCAGVYNAQVTDVNNCVGSATVAIVEPPPILNAPSIGLPLCAGVCDGTIALNTSGGNAPYTYSWSPVTSSSPTLANLCSGDYTVYVGYNSVCSESAVISIPVQTSITIVSTVTNNLCFGNCVGAIDLNLNGGTSPYSVSWSNSQTSPFINGLCNGTYSASVIDANGCLSTQTETITSGAQITTSTSVLSPSCGLCNGTASVAVSGGTSPFTFNWSNAATSAAVSSLCAGVYQVVITDNNLCAQTETIIINNSNGITGETINVQQIPCSGACVGAATVTAIGGNPPIAYNWVGQSSTTTTISNLCPGTYFVQMVDAQSCVRTASVNIDPLVTLSVSAFLQLPACGNNTAGVISLVISGGTPSYAISWNPPAGNSTTLTGLGAGVYSYTVTESGTNSCSVSNAINFSNSNGPVISASQNNINCFGANTGSIGIIVTSTATPLTYAWNTGANTPTLTNLNQGIITLTVTDVNSCKAFRTFTITENPAFNLGAPNVHNPLCLGDCTGSITLVPSGGVLPYNFVWSPNSFTSNPATSLCDGNYSVNITDALGCPLSSTNAVTSFTIRSTSAMTLTSNTFNSSCSSVADGSITVTPSGGVAAYNYLWNGPSGYTSTSQNATNILSGTYTLTVTDNLNCQRDTTLMIIPSLTVSADAGPNSSICPITGSLVLSAQGTGGTLTYKWFMYPDTLNSISTGATYTVSNLLEPEVYKLIVTSTVASCFASDNVNVDLFFAPTISMPNLHQIPIYTSVSLGGNPTTQSGNTLTWTPNTALSDPNAFNPLASNTLVTTYTLTVTDINGCTAMDTVRVELYPEINISSGFTPNGDGKNDLWQIDYLDAFPDCTVEIFNRWGDRLFNSTGYTTPFDGKFKGQDLPVGTYYYVININHPGYPKPITGPLTIFR